MHNITCISKSEVVIFLSFRKNKETKGIPVGISIGPSFYCQNYALKYIFDVVELHKNTRNPC